MIDILRASRVQKLGNSPEVVGGKPVRQGILDSVGEEPIID
jgi:hypothetical protein